MMKKILGLLGVLILLALPGFAYYSLDVSYSKGNETFNGSIYDTGGYSNTGYYPCYPNANCLSVGPNPYYVDYSGSYSMYYRQPMAYGSPYGYGSYGYPYGQGYGTGYTRYGTYGYQTRYGFYPTSSYIARTPQAYCTGYWCYS